MTPHIRDYSVYNDFLLTEFTQHDILWFHQHNILRKVYYSFHFLELHYVYVAQYSIHPYLCIWIVSISWKQISVPSKVISSVMNINVPISF